MKIFEIVNPELMSYSKKVKNPQDLGPISPDNMMSQYKVGSVIFDNEDGLGVTPNNKEIDYFGFTVIMKIDTFLKLAANHGGKREESANDIKELLNQGYGIATPMLYLKISDLNEETMKVEVTGHEGRARVICCQKYFNLTKIPVHIMPTGYRSKHITKEVFDRINWIGIKPEDGGSPVKNPFESFIE